MSSICVASFIAIALLGQSYGDESLAAMFHGKAFGKEYTVSVTDAAIQKTPDWADDEENPPVSARQAVRLATAMKDSLVKDSEDFKWELQSLSLDNLNGRLDGKWVWSAFFVAEKQGPHPKVPKPEIGRGDEYSPYLNLVVLMDGTVIKPEVKEISE